MTTPGGSRRTALALYRCILRWSAQNADVPFSVRASDIRALAPAVLDSSAGALSPAALQDAGAVAAVARAAFREAARASGAEAEATVDRGFEAVQVLNGTYARQLQAMRELRADRADRSGVKFGVGQVFVHKKFGYRAVVFGWDRACERDDAWLQAMSVSTAQQPFYHCLPDESDAIRLFGGVRITKYVAQENMEPLEGGRIVHRALDSFFVGYSPALGRYIPSRKLQYEYPDAYQAEDAAPVGDDANLLAHPEPEVHGGLGGAFGGLGGMAGLAKASQA
ncbi:F-box only 21 [Micractinium conductrix]|uniref:F-box only 21 n=1 Tax=Micractinium conductrix TaxID=554055 RepID=A0A2P6VBZ3_9CHLO|nr:F-box only 21 [Micractinium conductrix]|eukprot:PSC71606.1 F-box only 21 [Micractinium conductrix]